MCHHGTDITVTVINPRQHRKVVKVDACIADEIQSLNDKGVVTLGCCCGHGKAGQIDEIENAFGKWKEYHEPPMTLINGESVVLSRQLEYTPFPHYHANGEHDNVWQMPLKTGCITKKDCEAFTICKAK